MSQPNLFGEQPGTNAYGAPIAASADPHTSHEAARELIVSGKRAGHCKVVLALVLAMPGATYAELWSEASERDRKELGNNVEVMRRLNDLRQAGQIRQGESRPCKVRGRKMVTWWPCGQK